MSIARPIVVVTITTLLFTTACGGPASPASDPSTGASQEISSDDAKRNATTVVPGGTPGDVKKEDEGDEHRWLVDVKLPSGASIVVEVDRKRGSVAEITGKHAPYDYDFSPGGGHVSFADAKTKALAARAGDLKEWELDLVKTEYEFEIRGTDGKSYEVKVNSRTGAVGATSEKGVGK